MLFRSVDVGKQYKHYKGNLYEVIAVARDCEDPQRELVVYKALYDSPEFGPNQVGVRSKEDFLAEIIRDGKTFNRFEEVKENNNFRTALFSFFQILND